MSALLEPLTDRPRRSALPVVVLPLSLSGMTTPVQIDIPPPLQRHVAEQVVLWDFESVPRYLSYLIANRLAREQGHMPSLRETPVPGLVPDSDEVDVEANRRVIEDETRKLQCAAPRLAALPMSGIVIASRADVEALTRWAAQRRWTSGREMLEMIRADWEHQDTRRNLLESLASDESPTPADEVMAGLLADIKRRAIRVIQP